MNYCAFTRCTKLPNNAQMSKLFKEALMAHICICDNEEMNLRYLRKQMKGYLVDTFSRGSDLLALLKSPAGTDIDLLLQNVRMTDMDGLQILRKAKNIRPDLPVIMMTTPTTLDDAVQAIKQGAYDYLLQPFPREKVLGVVENVLEMRRLEAENRRLREELSGAGSHSAPVFASPAFRTVYDLTLKVAPSNANVLILGESGTGKELIAAALHRNSLRRNNAFVSLNCAALSDTLLESQLFGHIRGAFTGAITNQRGLLEESDGGTLFLDEIGDISPAVQAKLLRVIQERDFIPVGSTHPRKVDLRLLAATNKDLRQEVAKGRFREDLYYRLNVITIDLPPLRERKEDIEPLALHFLRRFASRMSKNIHVIAPDVLAAMQTYHWPGNVRELENVMERAVILTNGNLILPAAIPLQGFLKINPLSQQNYNITTLALPDDKPFMITLEEMERRHIEMVLRRTGYHKSRTAQILQISRRTLDRKIIEFELKKPKCNN